MRVLERLAQRGADTGHVAVGDRPRPQELGQRSAPNELGDEVDVVAVGGQLVDRDDRRVAESCGRSRLALHPLLARSALARDGLDGDLALELLVPCQPDDAEAACAEAALEPVAPEHESRAGGARESFGRVRGPEWQGPGLLAQAELKTVHSRFRFRSAKSASCPPFILPPERHGRLRTPGAILLSFLDEPDEPVARRTRRRPPGGPSTDRQTLMVRRTLAGGAVLLVLILLVLGFRGCLNARKESAIKDYVRESSELAQQSRLQGENLFNLLSEPGDQDEAIDRENAVNGLRVESATTVDQARDLDVPDELSTAQDYFIDALELRRDSIARVADELPGALADQERRQSTDQIAQVMQFISASDVLLVGRWKPSTEQTLESEDLQGEVALPRDRALEILPDIQWVDPSFVADQIEGIRSGTGATGDAAPGLHGNGLGTVSLGGVALTPGAGATVPLTEDLAFEVQVHQPGREQRDGRERARHGRRGRRGNRPRGVDRHDRRRRAADRHAPAGRAAPDRPERADQGRRRAGRRRAEDRQQRG